MEPGRVEMDQREGGITMKLVLTVKNKRTGNKWTEEYDSECLTAPGYFAHRNQEKMRVNTTKEAAAWGKALVEWFNSTCAPGQASRLLLKVELVEPSNAKGAV